MNARAQRIDTATGCIEVAEFVELGRDRIFATHHLPDGPASSGALVVCSPFFAEFARNYRREVLLSRHLAARGIPVTRFHHRGVGNSTGDAALMSLERMIEDARRVAEVARERSGIESVAFHGTRLAAFTAAGAAAGDKAAVSLWDPVVAGASYFNELLRTRMVQAVHDAERGVRAADLRSQLEQGAPVDVLGHSLHPGFYSSLSDVALGGLLGPDPRDMLVVSFGRDRNEVAKLVQALDDRGNRTTTAITAEAEAWWIANRRADYFVAEERRALTTELLATSLTWFEHIGWTS